jgi:hypothetical protein
VTSGHTVPEDGFIVNGGFEIYAGSAPALQRCVDRWVTHVERIPVFDRFVWEFDVVSRPIVVPLRRQLFYRCEEDGGFVLCEDSDPIYSEAWVQRLNAINESYAAIENEQYPPLDSSLPNPTFKPDWVDNFDSPEARAVFAILQKYYLAIEDGTAEDMTPDYTKLEGLPDPKEVLDAIDNSFYMEMRVTNPQLWNIFDGEPELARLLDINNGAPAIALCQELKELYSRNDFEPGVRRGTD